MKKELAAIVHIASIVAIVIGLMVIVFTLCFGHPTIGVTFAPPPVLPDYDGGSYETKPVFNSVMTTTISTSSPAVMCWSTSAAPVSSTACTTGSMFSSSPTTMGSVPTCESYSGTPNGHCEAGNPTPVR